DQIAIRKDLIESTMDPKWSKNQKAVPYRTLFSKYDVYIHPRSGLYGNQPPEMVTYQDLQRTIKLVEDENKPSKIYLRGITAVEPKWLPRLANGTGLIRSSKERIIKVDDKTQKAITEVTFGPGYWPLP